MVSVEKAGATLEAAGATVGEGATTGTGHDDGKLWPVWVVKRKSSWALSQIDFRRSIPAAKVSDFLPSHVLISSIDTQSKRDLDILFCDSW
jgi:hypothetical protein